MISDKLKEAIIRPIINVIPFKILKQISSCRLIIVYYHAVNDEKMPHIRHLYKHKGVKQFSDDLDFLLSYYDPIELQDVINWMRGENNLQKDSFLLTFDDGFKEIYEIVAPIILNKGIPATVFISSAFLDNLQLCYQHKASLLVERISKGISDATNMKIEEIMRIAGLIYSPLPEGILNIDYRRRAVLDRIAEALNVDFNHYLNEKKPYLNTRQVEKLIAWGFTIGAHSIDHPYYSSITASEQLEQTIASVKHIREKFGLNYGAFAFPHNDAGVSREFYEAVSGSGLVDITFGTGGMICSESANHMQRISLEKPLLSAREILAWQYTRKHYHYLKRRGRGLTSNAA